jgi:Protein of unknown function (DUF2637)
MTQLIRIRWAVRGALFLGVAASITGNVLHAQDNLISQAISAWSPIALLITIELISRIPVHRRALAIARWAATALIAGIAAWVSYWHMAAVASRYGETGASPYLLPLSVDGLVVVASVCLVELAGRIREAGVSAPMSTGTAVPDRPSPILQYAEPLGPIPAPVDRVSTAAAPVRKPQPTSRERIERAHRRTPAATNDQLAERLNLSTKTVQRWRPPRVEEKPPAAEQVNGNVPALVGAGTNTEES